MATIYKRDCEIDYKITTILVRTSVTYTTADYSLLLSQYRQQWLTYHGGVQRDITHLFTGKTRTTSVIGVAYLGTICDLANGYGLSFTRYTSNFTNRVGLTAHELGHSWNAQHCTGSTCYIMCAGLGGCGGNVTLFRHRIDRVHRQLPQQPRLPDQAEPGSGVDRGRPDLAAGVPRRQGVLDRFEVHQRVGGRRRTSDAEDLRVHGGQRHFDHLLLTHLAEPRRRAGERLGRQRQEQRAARVVRAHQPAQARRQPHGVAQPVDAVGVRRPTRPPVVPDRSADPDHGPVPRVPVVADPDAAQQRQARQLRLRLLGGGHAALGDAGAEVLQPDGDGRRCCGAVLRHDQRDDHRDQVSGVPRAARSSITAFSINPRCE
ncbi:MAG: hypothetical protein H6836_08025 [Planctomycetes bacterium]|nr:hypothetical protein [Planctomycetota bacterium]